jgi:hypothetical protein
MYILAGRFGFHPLFRTRGIVHWRFLLFHRVGHFPVRLLLENVRKEIGSMRKALVLLRHLDLHRLRRFGHVGCVFLAHRLICGRAGRKQGHASPDGKQPRAVL